jgi:hypothetical protein
MKVTKFFNHDFSDGNFNLFDKHGNKIYSEFYNGWWAKFKYDSNRNQILKEASDGFWSKTEYDSSGEVISYRCSDDGYKEGAS